METKAKVWIAAPDILGNCQFLSFSHARDGIFYYKTSYNNGLTAVNYEIPIKPRKGQTLFKTERTSEHTQDIYKAFEEKTVKEV